MMQVKRRLRYRSPPPLRLPTLPRPIPVRPITQNKKRPTTQETRANLENEASENKRYNPANFTIAITKSEQSLTESMSIIAMDDNTDILLSKRHLPVFAQFPFLKESLLQPMETNVDDNAHKLRVRLIDSELEHQRRSTDEYIKRTPPQGSVPSPAPTEHNINSVRSPPVLVHRQDTPKVLSSQTSISMLSTASPSSSNRVFRDRLSTVHDLQNISDLERDLQIFQIEQSLHRHDHSHRPIIMSNHHTPRTHIYPFHEKPVYSSSNMDDLIDSMARRHLAYRRLDAAIDRQRRTNGYFDPIDNNVSPRHHYHHPNDDAFVINHSIQNPIENDTIPSNPQIFNQRLRSRIDYYNRIQPDPDNFINGATTPTNVFTKLPPISPGHESRRSHRSQNPITPMRPGTRRSSYVHQQRIQPTTPLTLPNHTEHLIKLPSDIYLSSRKGQSRQEYETRSPATYPHSRREIVQPRNAREKKKPKFRRNKFKIIAAAIHFITSMKYRALQRRSKKNIKSQDLRARIHKIRLQEIIVAVHRLYLDPDGQFCGIFYNIMNSPILLDHALQRSAKHHAEAIQILGNAVKSIVSKITQLMPKDNVLGRDKSSILSTLLQDGNVYPENYFWHCEREMFEFHNSKLINITKQRAILLIIGIFIFRALVTTLLLKPIKYRLAFGQLAANQSINLKLLASIIFYISRRIIRSKPNIFSLPDEWQHSLYSDRDIQTIIQHSEINSIIHECEQLLRVWCEEYVHRIGGNFDGDLRT